MTRVIPPREAPRSDLGRPQPRRLGPRIRAGLRIVVMRLAACLLLAQGALAWLAIFGAARPDFASAPLTAQLVIGSLAVLLPMAAVGMWQLTLWGVALWITTLGVSAGPSLRTLGLEQLAVHLRDDPLLGVSLGLFVIFIVTVLLSSRDGLSAEPA
jgi:hypothetical protein